MVKAFLGCCLYELAWFLFIAGCALAGVAITVVWIRVQRRGGLFPKADAEEDAPAKRRGPPVRTRRRTPPPTPDLVSVQQAWRAREDSVSPVPPIQSIPHGTHGQAGGTPTAPSGPRQGWQGATGVRILDPSDSPAPAGAGTSADEQD